jgi:hypothetical protein
MAAETLEVYRAALGGRGAPDALPPAPAAARV